MYRIILTDQHVITFLRASNQMFCIVNVYLCVLNDDASAACVNMEILYTLLNGIGMYCQSAANRYSRRYLLPLFMCTKEA